MTKIEEILEEQGFSAEEKAVFLDMLSHAKTLQKNLSLDQLKPYMNEQIDKLIDKDED